MEVLTKKMTYAEFRNMELDDRDNLLYELINGEIMQRSSPTVRHQRIVRRLVRFLEKYLEEKPLGELFFAPLDVVLDDENVPQPDIFFIQKERDFIIDEAASIVFGRPDLVMEVISPGTVKNDRIAKKDVYERFGVGEYWLVDPGNATIEVYLLHQNRYAIHAFAAERGLVASTLLQGFSLEVAEVFV